MKRISSAFATSFRRDLLSFYDAQRRKLPWRESADAYRVLVSELMLQQTRVQTVIPYFERWLERFPNVDALAAAPIDDVLKQWEGLGYYSRARNLQRAAQMVRERHAGEIPADHDDLRSLPGVGPYTAAAVASIAFNRQHAAVDGNVKRVFARVLDLPAQDERHVQQYADKLLDPDRPGDYNQAVMELGATICMPRNPLCESCPVQHHCRAWRNGTVALRPAPKIKAALPFETVTCLVAVHDGDVLLTQRPAKGLLAGLWEFPVITDADDYAYLGSITHTFTHKRIEYRAHSAAHRVPLPGRWIPISEIAALALPTAQRKIARLAGL